MHGVGILTALTYVLTVEDLAFDENRTQTSPSWLGRSLNAAESSPVLMKYVALLAGLLLVVVFGVRPALKRAGIGHGDEGEAHEDGASQEFLAQAQTALPPTEPTPMDPERLRAQQVFEQVTDQLKREPAQTSLLLQSWIHSD